MTKSVNQLKAGALLSYLQMGLTIIVGLIYTPLMVRALGPSEYGLYRNSCTSNVRFLSFGNKDFWV